jgi:hypothetical protein
MRHTLDAVGRDGFQIWSKVAENILNNKSCTADKVWSSKLGIGRILITLRREKIVYILKKLHTYLSIT